MMLFSLIGMHFIMDYPLQGDFIGKFKNRWYNRALQDQKMVIIPWWHLMTAHAFIHGFGVVYLTGQLELGIFETIAHFIIDYAKCEGYTNIHVDQALHILCKIGYVVWMQTHI